MTDLAGDVVRLGLLLTLLAFGLWIGGASVAAWVGWEKGRDPIAWFVVAFFLSPLVALIAHDLRFWENLPRMFHNPEAINWFRDKGAHTEITAFRNGTLQGAYYLLALRAVGLDCGAMSGFDNAKVDAAFFPDGRWKSNFLVNIGYGSGKGMAPRNPRLSFEESCRIL